MPSPASWCGRTPASERSPSWIVPSCGRTNPQTALKRVVLPAPLGPMMPVTLPGGTEIDTSLSAASPPKRTDTPSTRRITPSGVPLGTGRCCPQSVRSKPPRGGFRPRRARRLRDGRAQLVCVEVVQAKHVHVLEAHDAFLVDDEHRSPCPDQRRADAIGLGRLLVGVGQQRDGQAVVLGELLMRGEVLRRDADDGGVEPLEAGVAVRAELLRADHRLVARVEEQDDDLAAVLGQRERAVGALEGEVGCRIGDRDGAHGMKGY